MTDESAGEDPFSAEFESYIEGVLTQASTPDDDGLMKDSFSDMDSQETQPKAPPMPPPKPRVHGANITQNVSPGTNVCNSNHGISDRKEVSVESSEYPDELHHENHVKQVDDHWPSLPDGLDQFTNETSVQVEHTNEPSTKEPCENQAQSRNTQYPAFIKLKDRPMGDSMDDSWSTVCEQGSKLSILEEDEHSNQRNHPGPGLTSRMTVSDRAIARAEIIRNRRQSDYENYLPDLPQSNQSTKHTDVSRSKSLGSGYQYENVVLPSERPTSLPDDPTTRISSSETIDNPNARQSAYENVFLPFEQPRKITFAEPSGPSETNLDDEIVDLSPCNANQIQVVVETHPPPAGTRLEEESGYDDEKDNLEDLEAMSDDDSYYSDSDFDDDEEIQNFQDEEFAQIGYRAGNDNTEVPESSHQKDILRHLVEAERSYVDKLHFLCRVVMLNLRVLNKIPGIVSMPPDIQKQIFVNLEVIFNFHSENLLPALDAQMTSWETDLQFGKTIKGLVPYFKLYIEYVERHKQSISTYDHWIQKNPIFTALIEECEKLPECEKMTIKQHLQDVANQVPKYQAALKDVLDHLPKDSQDEQDLKEAVDSLTQTCYDLAKAMGKDDRMKQLKDIQARLEGTNSIVKATREFLRDSKIKTVHPTNNRLLERHLFLFNDLLLLCGPKLITGKHDIRFNLDMHTLHVHEGDNLMIPYTFYVQSEKKALEFACRTEEDKTDWMKAVQQTVEKSKQWELYGHVLSKSIPAQETNIGKEKPEMVSISGIQACSLCDVSMGTLKRRYHCMGCGKVVCSKCSQKKAPLEYDNMKPGKVCDDCYAIIYHRELASGGTVTLGSKHDKIKPRDPRYLSGYMQLSANKGRTWNQRWFTVHGNGTLYCFKDHNADRVWTYLPLKRFSVASTIKADPVHKNLSFKLFSSRRTYYLQAESVDNAQTWINTLAHFCDSSV